MVSHLPSTYDTYRNSFFNEHFQNVHSSKLHHATRGTIEEVDAIIKHANLKQRDSIIELGAGDGRLSIPLLEKGIKVMAVDVAAKALQTLHDVAKMKHVENNLQTFESDYTKSEPELEGKFDAGLLASTFYMLASAQEERVKILNLFIQSIRKGGKLIILDPNPLCVLFWPYYLFHPRVDWHIEKNFVYSNRWTMSKTLKSLSLRDIQVIPFRFFPGFVVNKSVLLAKMNRIIAEIPFINNFCTFNFYVATKC